MFPMLQLVLTVMLLSIIVYVYTVIAFTFFRKFYVKDEDGEIEYKCHDMLTVSGFSSLPCSIKVCFTVSTRPK